MAPEGQNRRTGNINRKGLVALVAATVALSGCTSAVYPFNPDYATAPAADGREAGRCAALDDLRLVNCQLGQKIAEIDAQHAALINRPELFDVPLMAAAGVASGLLLFDGGTTALAAVGLAAGSTGVARQYFSPSNARAILRRGSAGYTCLLIYGSEAETYAAEFAEGSVRESARRLLSRLLVELRSVRRNPRDAGIASVDDVDALIRQAEAAILLFDAQAAAARVADSRLRMAAHSFGLTLAAQADRAPIDFSTTVQAVIDQAKANAAFLDQAATAARGTAETDRVSGGPASIANGATGKPPLEDRVRATISTVVSGMVSMRALVAGFDTCAVLAVPDATAPKIEIVFATLDGASG